MSLSSLGALIGQGRTAEIFAWQPGQIVKLFYAWCPTQTVEIESRNGRIVSALGLPTPKLLAALEIDGRQGLVYERVEGISMLKMINAQPWRLVRLARQLAELHTLIHQQDGTGLPSMRLAFSATIQQTDALPADLKTGVLHLFEKLPEGNALCHFDFHPDQVMMTTDGAVILDWMTAHQGHPLADVARTAVLLKVGQVPYGGWLMCAFINLWRGLFLETYLARYFELHPGLNRKELAAWMVPIAAARLNEDIPGEQIPLLGLIQTYFHQD